MNSWKKRNITMVGRIIIVKSLIIPNITYLASVICTNIDKEYVSKFKTMIYKFIWNDKREKVKRETMNKLTDQFKPNWHSTLQISPKALSYRLFKSDFRFEKYLYVLRWYYTLQVKFDLLV